MFWGKTKNNENRRLFKRTAEKDMYIGKNDI